MNKLKRERRTAIHEAGHVFAAYRLGVKVHTVTIKPNGDYLGRARHGRTHNEDDWYGADDRAQVRMGREIKIAYAGALAVKRAYPKSRWRAGAESDFHDAAGVIVHIYMDERPQYLWSSLLQWETELLLEQGWFAVEALADALIERRTLTGREATAVIQRAFADDLAAKRRVK